MDIGDLNEALSVVKEFRETLNENKAVYDRLGPEAAKNDATHQILLRRWPLIQKIVEQVDPESPTGASVVRARMWYWQRKMTPVERLVGILSDADIEAAIFSPKGPTLAASGMHRWVWDASVNLWDNEHYGSAVLEAAKAVELQTQLKLGRTDLDGKDLYAQVFSTKPPEPDNPRLRFPNIDEKKQKSAWGSAHEGAQHLGMGCAQGIRNPRAHSPDDLDEQEALEQLAALSVLARWVETCAVISA